MSAPLHERLAQLAGLAQISAPTPWRCEGVEIFDAGCDDHPLASCECNTTCRPDNEQAELAQYIAACHPANVAKLCEQVRVLLGAVQAVEDFISGKPDAPEPFGITRDALKFVKDSQ